MNPKITKLIEELRSYREMHFQLGDAMVGAAEGSLYGLDLLAVAILNRSLSLTLGFCTLLEAKYFVAAAPLIRLQLDNCLRFSAAWLVDAPHEFAAAILGGTPVRDQVDRSNKHMTDRYLAEELTKEHHWVSSVYKETSGYVHLLEQHFFNAMQLTGEAEVTLKISDHDEYVPDEVYQEAIGTFKTITELLFGYVHDWTSTKKTKYEQQRGVPGDGDEADI